LLAVKAVRGAIGPMDNEDREAKPHGLIACTSLLQGKRKNIPRNLNLTAILTARKELKKGA
jgi:hypothetical protein